MSYDYQKILKQCHKEFKDLNNGELASYIPELTKANPHHFAISISTLDNQTYSVGEEQQNFSLQSISKLITYAFALEHCDITEIEKKIGLEPSGESFDSITKLDHNKKPFNPMVNAGAIALSDLIMQKLGDCAFKELLHFTSQFAQKELQTDINVYESEKHSGYKNYAIANLLKNFQCIKGNVDLVLDFYFRQCSINANTLDLARIASQLASDNTTLISAENKRRLLSIMLSCGMYNYSGSWLYHIGVPAKSGVSGGLMIVVPRRMGIGIYSPKIDKMGNSFRGIQACKYLSKNLNLHMFI